MPGVFISYRRSDTADYAARLQEHLSRTFGGGYVFMDVDSLRPGEPFPEVIDSTITSSDVVLALIGRDWLTVTDASGKRRLEDSGDFVRIELTTALRFDRVLIPVLLERASMPAQSDLPESLVELAERHAIVLTDENWDQDVRHLVRRLEEVVDTIPECPYPGMVQFRRTEADRFFGRTTEIEEIERRLGTQRLLCLVGPSGCGKSSLLEAGVLAVSRRRSRAAGGSAPSGRAVTRCARSAMHSVSLSRRIRRRNPHGTPSTTRSPPNLGPAGCCWSSISSRSCSRRRTPTSKPASSTLSGRCMSSTK